jgi:hypothetical protein
MEDPADVARPSLSGLTQAEWRDRFRLIAEKRGSFAELGPRHAAAMIPAGPTLLVTFETMQGVRALSETGQPLGWQVAHGRDWSQLTLLSDGDTWFRDAAIYAHFDRLIDAGLFDDFDRVLFYGAGPCGYAAAAYSVAAPGATVLLIQPQATLAPEIAGWDDRFIEDRGRDFTTRFGYAPDMIDACRRCFVIYDPRVPLDAMHAALFTRPHVVKLPTRGMGSTIQTRMLEMQVLHRVLAHAVGGNLTRASFARLMRARRDHLPYLGGLLSRLESQDRDDLADRLCRAVSRRIDAPRFDDRRRKLHARRDWR